MNGELVLVWGWAEREPGRGTNREGFGEASRQGREEGGVVSGRGRGIDFQERNRAVRIHLGSKGEGESAVGGTEDLCRDVREGGGYGVPVWVGSVDLSWCVEPSSGSRERGGSGRDGRGGGSECGDRGRGSLPGFVLGGGGHLGVGASRGNGIEVSWNKLGDAGVAAIGKVGDFPGVRVGLGESRGVCLADVIHGIDPRKVWVEGGAIVLEGSRGEGFVLGLGSDRRGGQGSQGGTRGGSAYPM